MAENQAAGGAVDDLSRNDRHRLRRAWWSVGVPVLMLYTWVLTAGRWNLVQQQYYDDFYDAQARSLLHGHWDVPPEVAQSEGIALVVASMSISARCPQWRGCRCS